MSVAAAKLVEENASSAFRAAMRRVASTVAVIATRCGGQPYGMTATAVTSLTASPPSILVCINNGASLRCPIAQVERFCVNFLSARDAELCGIFSGAVAGPERFQHGDWKEGPLGMPILASADAALVCKVERIEPYHSHTIFIGAVIDAVAASGMPDPLIYCAGRTGSIEVSR